MYDIRFDPARRILSLKLSGFWTMATVARFGAEMAARGLALRLRYRNYAVFSDSSDFPVQSAQVSAVFERIMKRGVELDVGPCAIVVANHLNKMQARRLFPQERVGIFLDRAEAEAWLAQVWA